MPKKRHVIGNTGSTENFMNDSLSEKVAIDSSDSWKKMGADQ